MENRIYHCPICGKTYASLTEMYNCATKCEEKERVAAAAESRMKSEMYKASSEIDTKFKELNKLVKEFNNKYPKNSYILIMTHTNFDEKITDNNATLEDFLKTNLSIQGTSDEANESKTVGDLISMIKKKNSFPSLFDFFNI